MRTLLLVYTRLRWILLAIAVSLVVMTPLLGLAGVFTAVIFLAIFGYMEYCEDAPVETIKTQAWAYGMAWVVVIGSMPLTWLAVYLGWWPESTNGDIRVFIAFYIITVITSAVLFLGGVIIPLEDLRKEYIKRNGDIQL